MNDMIFWICWKWHEKEVGLRSTGGASGLEIGCPMGSTGKPENLRLYRMKLLVLFCVLIRSCTNFYLLTFNFFTQYSCTNTKIRPAPPIFLLSLHPIYNLAQCWKKATKNCNLHNSTFSFSKCGCWGFFPPVSSLSLHGGWKGDKRGNNGHTGLNRANLLHFFVRNSLPLGTFLQKSLAFPQLHWVSHAL